MKPRYIHLVLAGVTLILVGGVCQSWWVMGVGVGVAVGSLVKGAVYDF